MLRLLRLTPSLSNLLLKGKVQKTLEKEATRLGRSFFMQKNADLFGDMNKKQYLCHDFCFLLTLKSNNVMKKMMLIVAVALAALSCANKAEKAEEAEAAAPAAVEVAAPAPAEEQAPAEEKTLLERAVELGEDVAAEVEKNK